MKNDQFGYFHNKSFGLHFADDWLHIEGSGWMNSIQMDYEEKKKFIQFLNDKKMYDTKYEVNIYVERKNLEEPFHLNISGKGFVIILWIKHDKQWAKMIRKLEESLSQCYKCGQARPQVSGTRLCECCHQNKPLSNLCFSCDIHPQKYITGLCENCHQSVKDIKPLPLSKNTIQCNKGFHYMYNNLDMPLEALLNFCAEAAKIEDAEESEEALPFVSMTSGVIPPKVLFQAHWKVCCRDKLFNITPGVGQKLHFEGDFTCDEMWDIINKTVNEDVLDFDDEDSSMNLCSSVMYMLRFEWI